MAESLKQVGLLKSDGEESDRELVETGTGRDQREGVKNIKSLIAQIAETHQGEYSLMGDSVGLAPVNEVLERASEIGFDRSKVEHEIDKLKQKGEVYEPETDLLATT